MIGLFKYMQLIPLNQHVSTLRQGLWFPVNPCFHDQQACKAYFSNLRYTQTAVAELQGQKIVTIVSYMHVVQYCGVIYPLRTTQPSKQLELLSLFRCSAHMAYSGSLHKQSLFRPHVDPSTEEIAVKQLLSTRTEFPSISISGPLLTQS